MALRQINQYITEDPNRLSSQLSRLENNVAQEFQAVEVNYTLLPQRTPVQVKGGGTFTTGQLVTADTRIAGFAINLTVPTFQGKPTGIPGWVTIISTSGNTLQLNVVAPALINLGAGPVNITSLGLFLVFFDGANWWTK